MMFDEIRDYPVIDSHIHFPHPAMMPGLIEICDSLQIDRFNIVCTPHQQRLSLIPDALFVKAHHPDRVYVSGGLDVSAYYVSPQHVGEIFADYVDLLLAAGCDGIKMIEGKPDIRRMLPVPAFDSEAFAPYWEKIAKIQIPVVFHVNDPEEFWDSERIPDWAVERGWFYGDGDTIHNETQYSEVINVLRNHPDLKIVFAHFFFMSAQRSRLAELLDRFPNMLIDLTPGIEMYHNFSADINDARDFFTKYQDRIIFGTDIGAHALLAKPGEGIEFDESHERVFLIRNTLENPGEFFLPGKGYLFGDPNTPFLGLDLPETVLDKLYVKNAERIFGASPRPINPGAIVELCDRVDRMIQLQGSSQPGVPGDPSVVRSVRSYFETLT
jgi:predicted TIM-barrel fold metal-dependent hydrolase